MTEEDNFWLVVSNFTDKGITPRIYSQDVPLNESELIMINTYYASILSHISDEAIVGPLPVAYHPELLVLLYRFDLVDNEVKDKRIISEGGKSLSVVTIIYRTSLDDFFIQSRKNIMDLLAQWCNKFVNISEIQEEQIKLLKQEIEQFDQLETKVPQRFNSSDERKLLIRQLDFLRNFVKNKYAIEVISDFPIFLHTIREILFSEGHYAITHYNTDDYRHNYSVTMSNITIDAKVSNVFKHSSKNRSYIYFAEVNGESTSIKTNEIFQKMVNSLGEKDQCLLMAYSPSKHIDFSNSPLFETAKTASGKNISIVELTEYDTLESIITFMYQLIERMQ
ncbi:MAG: hypothetical protein ACTSQX_13940 [Candidatus Heimdallarchaeota archaeon]